MSLSTMAQPRLQFLSFSSLALTSAILLSGASILTNVSSAISRQPDLAGKLVSGSIAFAVAILTTVALAASLNAITRKQHAIAALALLTFALSAAFSVSSALGVLGGARLQSAKSVEHVENERTRLEFERRNAVNELATIMPARTPNELRPMIAERLAVKGVNGCVALDGPISKQHCPVIADLQSELARAQRTSALNGIIARHDADLKALGAPTIANKDAAAIAHVLAAINFKVSADTINTWLVILGVLILECGASLALATASALRIATPVEPTLRNAGLPARSEPVEAVATVPVVNVPTVAITPARPSTGLAADAAKAVLKLVTDNGGILRAASKNELARRVGASSATFGRALVIAAASGAVVGTESGEVVIRLAA